MNSSIDQCALSASFVTEPRYIVAQGLQICICIITLFVVYKWNKYIIRQLLNKNTKIIMSAILCSIVIHAIIVASTQLHHIIYDFVFARNSCDYIFSNFTCLFVKCFTHCDTINLPLLFLCICFERTVATYSLKAYHDNSIYIFRIAPFFTFMISLSFAGCVFYVDAFDSLNTASCLFNTPTSWYRVNNMYYTLMGFNLTAILWLYLLYLKNRRLQKGLTSETTTLTSRYQIKENLHITKVILICGSVQLTVTLIHETTNSLRRALVDYIEKSLYRELAVYNYFITYANLLFVMILYIILRKQEKNKRQVIKQDIDIRRRESAGGYFAQYTW